MPLRKTIAIFACSLMSVANGQQFSAIADDAFVPKNGTLKSGQGQVGQLKAQLVVTDDAKLLQQRWSSPAEIIQLNAVDRVQVGKPAYAFVILGGCTPDSKGNCRVTLSYWTGLPGGATHTVSASSYLMNDERALSDPLLSNAQKLWFSLGDQPGAYTVVARLIDAISGEGLNLSQTIQVIEAVH